MNVDSGRWQHPRLRGVCRAARPSARARVGTRRRQQREEATRATSRRQQRGTRIDAVLALLWTFWVFFEVI